MNRTKRPRGSKGSRRTGPLSRINVVDLTQNVAGPYAAMILAELGASVTKVEPPQGDATRTWGPPFWKGHSPTYLAINRNKNLVRLDLKTDQGRTKLAKLLKRADVVLSSARPGSMEKIGLDYRSLAKRHPRLIYGEITPFGAKGPRALEPGYDPLMQALTGIMSVTGHPGDSPIRVGVSIIDMTAGIWLALGTLAALNIRRDSSKGHRVSVSLFETGLAWMSYHFASFWASGVSPHGWGSGVMMIAPYEAFRTTDGWVIIAAGNDGLFVNLSKAFAHPEWAGDARFRTNAVRVENRVELARLVGEVTKGMSTAELEVLLKRHGVPAAPVRDVAKALEDPQVAALEMIQTLSGAPLPGFKSVGMPFTIDGARPPLRAVPF
ncbi:MAG: CoA transferase [Nitrososphaerota archaeon]|nr:CoA transferase [Nitrososphaerota archaeon]